MSEGNQGPYMAFDMAPGVLRSKYQLINHKRQQGARAHRLCPQQVSPPPPRGHQDPIARRSIRISGTALQSQARCLSPRLAGSEGTCERSLKKRSRTCHVQARTLNVNASVLTWEVQCTMAPVYMRNEFGG